MEKDDTFVLMSMKDKNSKELVNALSNETSRKILSYLSEKEEATETQIAKDLKLPLTTIHYNIKLLLNSKLVQSKEFYWSKKGKEMLVYKLAKKFIIISPSSDSQNALSKLKSLLPITLLAFIGSGIIYLLQKGKATATQSFEKIIPILDNSGNKIGETAGTISKDQADQLIPGATDSIARELNNQFSNVTLKITETIIEPNYALWFLLGSLFIILLVFLFSLRKKR